MKTSIRALLPLVTLPIFLLTPGKEVLADTVTLAWDASSGATGYKIYYGTAPHTYSTILDVGNVLTYPVPNLGPGTYYFAVTAYNAQGESSFSNEVSKIIAATNCTYSLSASSASAPAASSTGSVGVSTTSACAWSASSNVPWISITSGNSGSGNGTVSYAVAVNTTPGLRSGSLNVAGQTFTVNQAKAGCDITLDGSVNFNDIQVLTNVLLGTGACPANCDINGDGKVDFTDLQILTNVTLGARVCP